MKKFLYQALVSLVTGFLFIIGALLANELYESWGREEKPKISDEIDTPEGIKIVSHEREIGAANFTVLGTLQNGTEKHWHTLHISATVLAGKAQLNYCGKTITNVLPNSTVKFEIKCRDAAGSGLPDNIGYELKVEDGRFIKST